MIDEQRHITTPEGVPLTLALAGPVPRAVAYLIDACIRILVYTVGAMLLSPFGGVGWGLLLILVFLLEWFYPVWFEVMRRGQTPGKKSLGLAVVREDATPVDLNASLIRNLLRTADLFPMFYLAGFLCMLIDSRFRRLGDLAAGTLVVHLHPLHPQHKETPQAIPDSGDSQAPDWPLTLADRHLLLDYYERGPRLTPARRNELAQLAFPELGDAAAERLDAAARHTQGAN
ncbi:RDD family protein [Isoalcanivorax indicus]|uniref:RDD family protein n=1 Tax=Isoalcanivorax indicus TaxID=2202653 RepID=UPI000DB97696|nr:RDD family protein [Isoalcanivorax indicus]